MRSFEKAASSAGVINVGGGYSLAAVPVRGAMWEPLELTIERDGAPLVSLAYEPGRVMELGKWDAATLSGAVAGSTYRLLVGEAASERIGALPLQPVTLLAGEVAWAGTAGTYFVTNRNTTDAGLITAAKTGIPVAFDVRTAGRVEFSFHAPNVVDATGRTLAVYLYCYTDFYGTAGEGNGSQVDAEQVSAGSTNNFASSAGGMAGHIILGADADGESASSRHVAHRPYYVAPYFVLSGGDVEQDGVFFMSLRAWPP